MQKYSHFDFLLDKTGAVLKAYLDDKDKDPPSWELCKQLIEKSLSVATSASLAQGTTESELKVYEAQRIWQPLCLAMTVLSHLKWDLDIIQKSIPLHLQQILMEELLKGYGISQAPKPEDFDINKYGKRGAMVHIIYNRWVVRTITKYEVLKEKDVLPTGISTLVKETKELQEQQIFTKIKEYRNLSLDILEKSLFLESDTEIPLPMPRLVTETEIIPQTDESDILRKDDDKMEEGSTEEDKTEDGDNEENKKEPPKEPIKGTIMKVPPLLEESLPVTKSQCILKICYDLGCYYFPKELYSDAWRVFQKAFEIANQTDNEDDKNGEWYSTMIGYYEACCLMLDKPRPDIIKRDDIAYRFEESCRNDYKDIIDILIDDNQGRKIPFTQRQYLEEEFYRKDKRDSLFFICALNFIRSCLEDRVVPFVFYECLKDVSKDELAQFYKYCKECLTKLSSELLQQNLTCGVRLVTQYITDDQRMGIKESEDFKIFFKDSLEAGKRQRKSRDGPLTPSFDESLAKMSSSFEDSDRRLFSGLEGDERISSVVKLKAKLTSCFDPETIKDILFELHETDPDRSHSTGYECDMYEEIFSEVIDMLMFDTIHVCITKSKQLSLQENFTASLAILNICLDTLNNYAKRASQGCNVARVKNILHHELLWIELKLAETNSDRTNLQETMRRSKACIQHRQQDPPPRPHIYKAIVIHLLNNKEYEFLVDAVASFDTQVVDFLQLGFHFSSVICGIKRGVEAMGKASSALWEAVLKIVGDSPEAVSQGQTTGHTGSRARGPAEEKQMWSLKCYITKEYFISLLVNVKDDLLISLMLSCLSSLLCLSKNDPDLEVKDPYTHLEIKDLYTHLWPTSIYGNVTIKAVQVLSVLRPLCEYCLEKNPQNTSWLRTIADVHLAEGNYTEAMKRYLEIGSVSTSFFSRPVPYSIWDDKIYRNMILCCQKQEAHTQVIIFCQFTEPIDYPTAFKAIHKKSSDDGMDTFYDCLWDVNIFEYLIYAHNKKGEIEKRKLAVKTLGQPELNCRGSPEILQQSQDIRKTRFLRTLTRIYWR